MVLVPHTIAASSRDRACQQGPHLVSTRQRRARRQVLERRHRLRDRRLGGVVLSHALGDPGHVREEVGPAFRAPRRTPALDRAPQGVATFGVPVEDLAFGGVGLEDLRVLLVGKPRQVGQGAGELRPRLPVGAERRRLATRRGRQTHHGLGVPGLGRVVRQRGEIGA